MQIIIVGCGKVGVALTAQLSKEDNNVTIIDNNYDRLRYIANMYDVMGVFGNGATYNTLSEADIEHTDILIAVTESDELNLLCCVIAKKAANCHTIARVRNPAYSTEREFIRRELGLSMIINPELAAAHEIARLLRFPSAIEIDSFSKGRIDMLRFKVPENSYLSGFALKDISTRMQCEVLVCVVQHGDEVIIPDGNYMVQAGDTLSIIATQRFASDFFRKIGIHTNQVKSALIVGGGEITYYLAMQLETMGIDVKIIEKNRARCEELSQLLPKAMIIHGDGSDQELLNEEHLENMEAFVACTDMDEENIILSLYARGKVKKKTITKINHLDFNDVIHALNLDSLIYPKHITAEYILQYVRAMRNSIDCNVETLYKLMDDKVEALEFIIRAESSITNVKLEDLILKKNILVACIIRKGKVRIPGGQDYFAVGDSVIVVTTHSGLQDIHDIVVEK
ncbi:MAG: Trk system potassium transporter TrkA [Lachnospiraceae bacterium]|nr:Trk system potassium transporter TrkA [Lachnospiraceae bacterium]